MIKMLNGPQALCEIKKCFTNRRGKFRIAVAYWGNGAEALLKVVTDDSIELYCDLESGGCNPSTIKTLLQRGLYIRKVKNLHAKIYILDDIVIIGSSNVSTNGLGIDLNSSHLIEANIKSDDPSIIRAAHEFINSLDGTIIRDTDIADAMVLYKARKRSMLVSKSISLYDIWKDYPPAVAHLYVAPYDRQPTRKQLDYARQSLPENMKKSNAIDFYFEFAKNNLKPGDLIWDCEYFNKTPILNDWWMYLDPIPNGIDIVTSKDFQKPRAQKADKQIIIEYMRENYKCIGRYCAISEIFEARR